MRKLKNSSQTSARDEKPMPSKPFSASQTNKQTNRQTNKQTNKETNKETNRHYENSLLNAAKE